MKIIVNVTGDKVYVTLSDITQNNLETIYYGTVSLDQREQASKMTEDSVLGVDTRCPRG